VEKLRRAADERFRAKEQELEQQLRETETKLTALESKGDSGGKTALIVTPEQEQEIEHFQTEKLRIRKELRAVRAGLDAEIKRLGTLLKIINIVVVPAACALAALLIAGWRRRHRAVPAGAAPVASATAAAGRQP